MRKEFYSFYLIPKVQLSVGSSPDLTTPPIPHIGCGTTRLSSVSWAFLSELEDNFGPHDPVGDAKKSLHEVTMKKGAHIVKYNIDFWELAS